MTVSSVNDLGVIAWMAALGNTGMRSAGVLLVTLAMLALSVHAVRAQGATRLPATAVPLHYDLTIVPDLDAGTFHGSVVVDVDVRAPTDRLVLNARDLAIGHAELVDEPDAAPRIALDREAQTLTVGFARPLAVGRHRLALEYDGVIQRDQPYGLFTVSYDTPDGKRRVLATQFEPADARRLLPCWDEPAFKARFTVSVIVPAGYSAFSNMKVTRTDDLEQIPIRQGHSQRRRSNFGILQG